MASATSQYTLRSYLIQYEVDSSDGSLRRFLRHESQRGKSSATNADRSIAPHCSGKNRYVFAYLTAQVRNDFDQCQQTEGLASWRLPHKQSKSYKM